MDEVEVKEYLIKTDEQFRKLAEEHQDFDRQLRQLLQKPYLNSQEQVEEVNIKKRKLALKDQMQFLINQYRQQQAV